jgi:hypothetical protein
MGTDPQLSPAYILQEDVIRDYIPSIGMQQWQVIYQSTEPSPDTFTVFSALVPRARLSVALSHESWDLSIGDELPGLNQSGKAKKNDIRPLVIFRHFHDAWSSYLEICEEFRHFHDLAEDRERGTFLAFDESGYPIEVIRLQPKRAEISLSYLLQFLTATHLHLALFFDVRRFSLIALEDIPEAERQLQYTDDRSCYLRHVGLSFNPSFRTFSRVVGKVVIAAPPVEKRRKRPFRERKSDPEISFVIGVNPDGTLREFTSYADKLSNYFGANPDAPHYLTPVYFRKQVLSKYYADPDRYSISDGELACLDLWSLSIDNDHSTHVNAFLGDLGKALPYHERLHWKQFNVPPEGDISDTNFRRSFLGEFAPPEAADLVFRSEYRNLSRAWLETMAWPLYLEPEAGDEYLLTTIRVPVTSSQLEFDQQVLTLTKLLVDSLNEQALLTQAGPGEMGEKGITKLERFLASRAFSQTTEVIKFLRDLQALRSATAGHRKGKQYDKLLAKLGYDAHRKPELIERLLREAVGILRTLSEHFCRDIARLGTRTRNPLEGGPNMKHEALTLLINNLNRVLDTGRYDDIPLDEVASHIEDGSILQFIRTRAGKDIDFGILLNGSTYDSFERFYVTYVQSLLHVYGSHNWGVSNRGLCLLIALTNEIIQQGSDWQPEPRHSWS